jgi:hypothetical protein
MIIAVVALVSLARAIFFSGNRDTGKAAQQIEVGRTALLNVKEGNSVRMTVRGPIVAEEEFNSLRITVSSSARSLVTYRGYLDKEIDRIELGNNVNAYTEFVNALDKANLALGVPFEGEKDNTHGICATGRIYEYEIFEGGKVVQRLWASTCKGSPGSLKASIDQLTNLFIAQIPDARTHLNKINF